MKDTPTLDSQLEDLNSQLRSMRAQWLVSRVLPIRAGESIAYTAHFDALAPPLQPSVQLTVAHAGRSCSVPFYDEPGALPGVGDVIVAAIKCLVDPDSCPPPLYGTDETEGPGDGSPGPATS